MIVTSRTHGKKNKVRDINGQSLAPCFSFRGNGAYRSAGARYRVEAECRVRSLPSAVETFLHTCSHNSYIYKTLVAGVTPCLVLLAQDAIFAQAVSVSHIGRTT